MQGLKGCCCVTYAGDAGDSFGDILRVDLKEREEIEGVELVGSVAETNRL